MTTATAGATDTPPPEAPVLASVVMAFSLAAESVRLAPPVRVPRIAAVVVAEERWVALISTSPVTSIAGPVVAER